MPKISVIVPAYNVAHCLPRAVQSVLKQSFQDFEILIIDDASTDNTLTVALDLAANDACIKVFSQSYNQGPSAARNRGLNEARAEWAAILDADDAMQPGRLAGLLALAVNCNADIVADDLLPYDQGADQLLRPAFGWKSSQRLTLDFLLRHDVYGIGYPLGWIKPMWKIDFLRSKNLEYPPQYRHAEDFFMLASALLNGANFWLEPAAGYIYTLRQGPISGKASPFSASRPDLNNVAKSCQELIEKYKELLSKSQIRQLKNRVLRFVDGHILLEIRNLLNEGNILHAIKKAASNPKAIFLYSQIKFCSLKRKLSFPSTLLIFSKQRP